MEFEALKTCEVCGETSAGEHLHNKILHRLDDRISALESPKPAEGDQYPSVARNSLLHNELMRALDVMHDCASALGARRLLATKRETMTTPIYESMTAKAWDDAKIEAHLLDTWELIVMAINGHTELECSGCKDAKGQWVGPCEDGRMHRSWCSTGIREVRRQNGSPMDDLVCAPMVPKRDMKAEELAAAERRGRNAEKAEIVALLEAFELRLATIVARENDPQMRARLGVYEGMAQDIREEKHRR